MAKSTTNLDWKSHVGIMFGQASTFHLEKWNCLKWRKLCAPHIEFVWEKKKESFEPFATIELNRSNKIVRKMLCSFALFTSTRESLIPYNVQLCTMELKWAKDAWKVHSDMIHKCLLLSFRSQFNLIENATTKASASAHFKWISTEIRSHLFHSHFSIMHVIRIV